MSYPLIPTRTESCYKIPTARPGSDVQTSAATDVSTSLAHLPCSSQAQHRSDIWFPDGNIILIAEQVMFKVHRGQLERHSDVFQDMFSLPQPPDTGLYDGCRILELHDSAQDVHHLLRALYDGLYVVMSQLL